MEGWEGKGMNGKVVKNKENGRNGKGKRKNGMGGGNQREVMARDIPLFVLIICNNEIIIIRDIDRRVTSYGGYNNKQTKINSDNLTQLYCILVTVSCLLYPV